MHNFFDHFWSRGISRIHDLCFSGGEGEGEGGSKLENLLYIDIELLDVDRNGWIRINGQKWMDRNGKNWIEMEKNGKNG